MTRCITACEATIHLRAAGHTDSTRGPAWTPGYRATQASLRTVRIWHDGPDEQRHLAQYTQTLRAAGFTVTAERQRGKRPRIRVTHP